MGLPQQPGWAPLSELRDDRGACPVLPEAIKAREGADILTWVNRLIRVQYRERDLFGKMELRSRLVRTSNTYMFRDP
jgi:hypothetical protein